MDVKLGHQRKDHNQRLALRIFANKTVRQFSLFSGHCESSRGFVASSNLETTLHPVFTSYFPDTARHPSPRLLYTRGFLPGDEERRGHWTLEDTGTGDGTKWSSGDGILYLRRGGTLHCNHTPYI